MVLDTATADRTFVSLNKVQCSNMCNVFWSNKSFIYFNALGNTHLKSLYGPTEIWHQMVKFGIFQISSIKTHCNHCFQLLSIWLLQIHHPQIMVSFSRYFGCQRVENQETYLEYWKRTMIDWDFRIQFHRNRVVSTDWTQSQRCHYLGALLKQIN